MPIAARRLIRCLLLSLGMVCAVAGIVPAATLAVESESGVFGAPLAGDPLLDEGGLQAAAEAERSNPEAVAAREASRTEFDGLNAEQAATTAGEAFPDVINVPAGGLPPLPAGQTVTGYVSESAASVELEGGEHGVVESVQPIAVESSAGQLTPVDLGLKTVGGGFTPTAPVVEVSIPRQLDNGALLKDVGVSLTPVDGSGAPLGGSEGVVDGSAVLYANTQTDMDSLIKPTTDGLRADTLLRSPESAQQIFLRVGLPAGGKVVPAQDGSGGVEVVAGGTAVATIFAPAAQDATGWPVPVSMSLTGDTLELTVDHRSGEYQYPIEVDPELTDSQLTTTAAGKKTNWEFYTTNTSRFASKPKNEEVGEGYLETYGTASYSASEWAYWGYQTKGKSKIWEYTGETEGKNVGYHIESFLELQSKGAVQENKKKLSSDTFEPEYARKATGPICPLNEAKTEQVCLPTAGGEGNVIRFQQSVGTPEAGKFAFIDYMYQGVVSISEPSGTRSTTKFNTTSAEVEDPKTKVKRPNALFGSGGWLSNFQDAIEPIAEDKGIGVADAKLEFENTPGKWEQIAEHNYLETENGCKGVQCYEVHGEYWTVPSNLPNGEDTLRYRAQEAIGSSTESLETEPSSKVKVKVDKAAPHGIALVGLPYGNELSERTYALTVKATDGEAPAIASSGIKSIALSIDGSAIGTPLGSCTAAKGECTASGTWQVKGSELGAGHHAIEVLTFDNAKNEARRQFEITIRHSTPVAVGPGSVDLQSGDFSFSAGDVSMGSGLSVSQSYSSRAVEQGAEGGLGPQWTLGLSSTESLEELVDGAVLMTDGKGRQSVFAPTEEHNAAGELVFEAPVGDSNLAMTLSENKATKQKLAYFLRNAANGTSVQFTLPTGGSRLWMPTRQEGAVASDTVIYTYQTVPQTNEYPVPAGSTPWGMATGSDGNLWFVETGSHKIARSTTAGAVIEYALPSGLAPHAITAGPEGTLWFTAWTGATSKVGKITTQGAITEYALPANSNPSGIVTGPDGEIWFTNAGTGKVGKITTVGASLTEYALPAGSAPNGITAGPDGNLWYTEWIAAGGVSKIGKITTAGVMSEYGLPAGSEPFQITPGPKQESALWFTDLLTDKVGKITTSGTPTEYSLLAGSSSPEGITAGPDGNVWFADEGASKIGKITTAGTVSEYALPAGANPDAITTGPEGYLWFANQSRGIGMMTPTGTVTRPTEALAPVPAEVTCAPGALHAGCRVLAFKYATATTATGENESQWGDYNGRLKQVLFEAYNPTTKKMEEPGIPVAEYRYDQLGRLRAEWDPRLSTPLKTTYGYDEYGHVTAISPPGQEPWTLTYGTANNDLGTGRLMKVARAAASEALWGGEAIKNTERPQVSGPPVPYYAATKVSVSKGKWSPAALTYSYQWKDCNTAGGACSAIIGATNENYTVAPTDSGHTLRVEVAATNGGGSATVLTGATSEVKLAQEFATLNPRDITPGPTGENTLWFTEGNGVGKITTAGTITSYTLPSGGGPEGIAAGPDGNVWFTVEREEKAKIGKITPAGAVTEWEITKEKPFVPVMPGAIVAGPKKENALWFVEETQGKIGKITTAGVITEYKIPGAIVPESITVGPDENLWFTIYGNKIVKLTTAGVFTEYATPSESHPRAITAGPDGNLWVAESGTATFAPKIAKINTSGVALAEYLVPAGVGSEPLGITPGKTGENALWFTEYNNLGKPGSGRAGRITTSGEITEGVMPVTGTSGIALGPDNNVWLTARGVTTGEIGKINPDTTFSPSSPQPGWAINYNVPLEGTGAPAQMGINETTHKPEPEAWGQNDDPVEATAITPPDSPQGWPAASYKRATTYYLDEQGRNVNVAQPSTVTKGSVSTTEYNEQNDVVRTLSVNNRATALAAGTKSVEVSHLLDTINQYNEPECRKESSSKEVETAPYGTRLCESWGPQHLVKYAPNGFKEQHESLARIHAKYFYEDTAHGAPGGEQYNLVTETSELALLANEEEVEVRKTSTSYSGQEGLGWKLRAPTSVTASTESEGLEITHTTLYNKNTGQIIETRAPKGLGGSSPHDGRIIYYTSALNTEGFAGCGKHPEWAELVCVTLPAKQPTGTTVPKLPVTTTTYNLWNEREEVVENIEANGTFPATTRTRKNTYDAAGRLESSETTSTADTALPKVKDKYSSTTGMLESQSTTVGETTTTVAGSFNKLGQMESYTDADGNTAKYKYGTPANDGLLEEMSDSSNAGASSQKYSYDTTTKALTRLEDSAAGTFTATFDGEGNLATEIYPNAMCAKYTHSSTGEATQLEYLKTSNCSESKPVIWFSEIDVPSVRGETMSRTSTLASESYAYDRIGRLTEAQETPAGEGCVVRLYSYDEESNREKLISRTPGTEGKCTTTGGTKEPHTYDEANRLTDGGIKYDPLGNITELPAADAEGHAIKSTFYVSGAVATQEQNGTKNEYALDPAGRTRQTTTGLKTITSHYDAPGEAIAWTSEGTNWTRNIPGIDGALTAIQTNGGTSVLQLHDLKGNITATAALSPSETKLLSTYNNTEFGVPNSGKTPPPYSWLGATDIANTLPSGVITYGATSYIPQTGRPLQATEIEPPGAPGGTGVGAPVDFKEEPWVMQGAAAAAAETPGIEAAEQKAAAEKLCAEHPETCPTVEGPGEETFGDPVHCYVGGTTTTEGHKAGVFGQGGCNEGLPAGTWLYVCVGTLSDLGPQTNAGCNHVKVEHHRSRHWSIGLSKAVHCESNEIVRALVEFYVPGGKVMYAGTENGGECGGGTDGVSEAALTLFFSPDKTGVVELLLAYFRGE